MFFFHYYYVWGWKWLLHFITWPPKSLPLLQMFLPAQLLAAAFPEIFSFSQLSVWMSWRRCATSVYSELRRPHCCCIYFQTLRASPLTLNHMRLCQKNPNISGLLLAGCALKALRNIEISAVLFTDPLTLSSQTFPCVQSSLCVRIKSQTLNSHLNWWQRIPIQLSWGLSQTSRPWCSISSANGRCSRPTLGYFTFFPPACIILSCFNLLFSLQRRQKEPRDIRNREKNKRGWKKKYMQMQHFCGLVEIKPPI